MAIAQSQDFQDFRRRVLTAENRLIARSRDGVSLLARRVDDTPTTTNGRGGRRGDFQALIQYVWGPLVRAESTGEITELEMATMGVVWKLQRSDAQ